MRNFFNILITSVATFFIAIIGFVLCVLTCNTFNTKFLEIKCSELIRRMGVNNAEER